jgi:hypothetical protein
MVPNLSQINLSTPSHPISLKFVAILSCHMHIGLPSSLFRCSDKIFYAFLIASMICYILCLSCFECPNICNTMQPSQCKLPRHPGESHEPPAQPGCWSSDSQCNQEAHRPTNHKLLCLSPDFTLVSCLAYSVTLNMEVICFSEMSGLSMDYMTLYPRRQNSS